MFSPRSLPRWIAGLRKRFIYKSIQIKAFYEKTGYILYWEDVHERVLYAQLDDYAWKLPEKIFGYKKQNLFYIYHNQNLAAYYHLKDAKKEMKIGFSFYINSHNVKKIIHSKKWIAKKVKNYEVSLKYVSPKKLNNKDLLKYLLSSLNLYYEALSTHYLTQPQFFEKFEKNQKLHNQYKESLKNLAHARLVYTRAAWTKAMQLCKPFFIEYAKRHALTIEEAESMTLEELRANTINKKILKQRANKYVLVSRRYNIKIFIGSRADKYIRTYEQYKRIKHVKGIVGNNGLAQGKAFVVSNENLDLKNLPKGMKRGWF